MSTIVKTSKTHSSCRIHTHLCLSIYSASKIKHCYCSVYSYGLHTVSLSLIFGCNNRNLCFRKFEIPFHIYDKTLWYKPTSLTYIVLWARGYSPWRPFFITFYYFRNTGRPYCNLISWQDTRCRHITKRMNALWSKKVRMYKASCVIFII